MAQAIHYCDRCARLIPPGETGQALVAEKETLCASCAKALSPDERAALTGRTRAPRRTSAKPRVAPRPSPRGQRAARGPASAAGRRAPVTTTPGTPRKVSQTVILAGLGAGALAGLALIVLLSGDRKPRRRERTSPARLSAPMARARTGPPPSRAGGSAARNRPDETSEARDVPPKVAPRAAGTQETGLVGWWQFDEAAGTAAGDSSGKGNKGELKGDAKWRPGGGRIGGALELDGSGDYVDLGNVLNAGPDWTVMAWINLGRTGLRQEILSKEDTTDRGRAGRGYELSVHKGGEVEFGVFDRSGKWPAAKSPGAVTDTSRWHHVAGVRDGKAGVLRVYVDGVERRKAPAGGTPAPNSAGLQIGRSPLNKWYYRGLIDDVRIYSRALGAEEIRALAGM